MDGGFNLILLLSRFGIRDRPPQTHVQKKTQLDAHSQSLCVGAVISHSICPKSIGY